jgi:hypothetical protein
MLRHTPWVLGFLGAASLGLLAYTGLRFASSRTGAGLRPGRPAPPIGTATATTTGEQTAATVSPNPDRSGSIDRRPASGEGTTPGTPADLTLGKEQREYLWQVEHHGLILSRRGFSRIAKALKDNDAGALLALFADGFEGEVPGQPREVRFERDAIRVVRQQDSGQRPVHLDRDGVARRLLDDRRRFSRPPTVKLALMALAPVDGKDLDGVWQGTCQLRMFGDMGPGRLGEVVLYLRYRLPRPTEELLGSDGWLRSIAITQRQVAESPRFLMREVAAERGINVKRFHDNWATPERTRSVAGGINLCDFNRDGCLDLLITDLSANVLYQGRPDGTFTDVTQLVNLPRSQWLINATFTDLDGDGWEDLIYGNVILRNNEGRSFSLVLSPGFAMQNPANLAVADFDRDGKLDLYETTPGLGKAASWIKGEAGGRLHNRLWRNLGNWRFADVTESSGTAGGNRSTFAAVWLDADEDGWPDLYVINEFGDGVLLVNQADGTFREHSIAPSPGDFGSMGLTAGDFDNDGHVDLYVGNMYSKAGNRIMANLWPGSYPEEMMAKLRSFTVGSQLHRNRGGLKFEQVGRDLQVADVGWAFGPAMLDLDNDGWLDIYATCGFISRNRDDPDG